MLTSLITDIPSCVFSSELGTIGFESDSEIVEITLSCAGSDLLTFTLFTYEGQTALHDLRDVIEENMRLKKNYCEVYSLSWQSTETVTKSFLVLYCESVMPLTLLDFHDKHFLSTLHTKKLSRQAQENLTYFALTGENTQKIWQAVIRMADGTLERRSVKTTVSFAQTNGIQSVDVSHEALKEVFSLDEEKILSVLLSVGDRNFTLYFTDAVPSLRLNFRNIFGATEQCELVASTTHKTEVERAEASIEGKTTFYNQKVVRSHEAVTAPLSSMLREWINQLFMSHEVLVGNDDIIITDVSCEVTDDSSQVSSVKFTWRYADNRPHVPSSLFKENDKIFTEVFSPQYT